MRERLEAANLASHMENPGLLLSFLLLVAATRLSGQQGPPSRADFARIGVEQGRPSSQSGFDIEAASRFAQLALDCVHKEYPNKIAHSMNSDADVAPPRKLTPAFYGCYDWHSSVHGHWLLARLARTFPDAPFALQARAALQQSLTGENLQTEASYLEAEGRASFERPYGLAWLLQLTVELRDWAADDPKNVTVHAFYVNLLPLEQSAVDRLKVWLPKLSYPVRIGEHNQTAFAMGLMIDYARRVDDQDFTKLLLAKARQFYLADKNCPLAYEPSGEDFLSPCMAEADLMRRVLSPPEFASWLYTFLPQIPRDGSSNWLPTQTQRSVMSSL